MRSLFGNLHPASSFGPLSGRTTRATGPSRGWGWFLLCAVAGWLQAVSLAWPFRQWVPPGFSTGEPVGWLQVLSLAVLALAWRHSRGAGQAAWRGWVFATAWLSGTFWWLFISMHVYGGLAAPLAVLGVHLWITPLPDWAVRLCGVVLLCGVFALSFSTVRLQMRK